MSEAPPRRMASHAEDYRVTFGDTDAAGVVFYPNYYRWFDRMTHELLRATGQPLETHWTTGQAPVLIEAQCRFLSSLRYDDLVRLEAEVTDVRERTFRVDHRIRRASDMVAHGYEIRAWVRMNNGNLEPRSLPADVRAALLAEKSRETRTIIE